MNTPDLLRTFLSNLWPQAPALLACLVAIVVVIVKWHSGANASIWALLGFAIILGMGVLSPLVYALLPNWTRDMTMSARSNVYQGLAVFWALVRCLAYVFLLVAIFAGRARTQPPPA